ncbi:serine/threonine-protein phosphatase [Elysia marginata]|uniref:Serine/threonine-protein phosphatase n=1 Tax=Elysia marginata TaxID=1093978 RepID=A0AAV4EAM6_9GAST|nr:serine/threonine-protein phosphatase [Elysia marginata]
MLTDHKLQRVEIPHCDTNKTMDIRMQSILVLGPGGNFRAKNTLFHNLITGDETWVPMNTPDTKPDSRTWKHPSSPVPKKFKVQRSAAKVMATVIWDAKVVILLDIATGCGNVAAILELDENLKRDFTIFEAAPQESRGIPSKKPQPDYFL